VRALNLFWQRVVLGLGVILMGYQITVLGFAGLDSWMQRSVFLVIIMVMGFVMYKGWRGASNDRPEVADLLCAGLSILVWGYIMADYEALSIRMPVDTATLDFVVAIVLVCLVIELARRAQGTGMMVLGVAFVLYALFGEFLPTLIGHPPYSATRIFGTYMGVTGIYGEIMGIASTYVFVFILFGAIMAATGVGDYLLMLSNFVAGRTRGGPAKVATVGSGFFGSISGSAVANVVGTGSVTIPMMKRVGYAPHFAGAVEAAASTGGQIMPPVMGAGAFIMAELTNTPYSNIALAALIPSFLYFYSVFLRVDFEAAKSGLKGLSEDQLPRLKEVLIQSYKLLPLVVLIYTLLIAKYSIIRVGFLASLTCVVVSFFNKREERFSLRTIRKVIFDVARDMIGLTAVVAVAGIVVATLTLVGVALKMAGIIVTLSGGVLIVALFLTMILAIILGMGMPTTAAYIVAAAVLAPAISQMGVDLVTAHLFIFYYACMSAVTPPVAVAAYAGATIAGANMTKVGWTALNLALAAFIVPFMFVYGPALLWQGSGLTIFYTTLTAAIGVTAMVGSTSGWWLFGSATMPTRVVLMASGLALIHPGLVTDLFGAAGLVLSFLFQYFFNKRNRQRAGAAGA
jgi:TRAP transporter 4TM/12TM fusion protein